jgi:hypothetical protein
VGIVVACRCGQAFEADLYLAGKVVQCPACHSPLAVPTPVVEPPVPVHVPRPRPALSPEERETNESFALILGVGIVLLMAVIGVSITIVGYLKGTDPLQIAVAPDTSVIEDPGARPADALIATPVPGGLPEGWEYFDHSVGRFSALFPTAPNHTDTEIGSLVGTHNIYSMLATKDEHFYEARREFRAFTMSRGQEAAAYETLLKRRAAEMEGGRIEGSNNAMVDGRLVCDGILRGKVEGTEFRKYLRIIAADDWVLELSCRVPLGKERPADIRLFLGNYKVQ